MNKQNENKDSEEDLDNESNEIRKSDFDTFFADLDNAEEEVSSEAYDLVAHALSLIEGYYYDDAIEILRQAIGLYSQINRVAEIEAINRKISETYMLKEKYFRELESESIDELAKKDVEKDEIYTRAYELINKGKGFLAMENFNEALDNYDDAIKLFQNIEDQNEIEKVNKLIEECYNKKADYLKKRKSISTQKPTYTEEQIEISEEDLKQQRIKTFKETKQHEEEISKKAYEILDKASEFAKIHQYDKAINLYLRGSTLFKEINWLEEIKKIKATIEQLEIVKAESDVQMAQLKTQEGLKKLEQEKAVKFIEKAKIEEEVRIQMQKEKLAEAVRKKEEEEVFRKKIMEMVNKAEKLAREYDIEMKKAIKKGDLLEYSAYPEVIAIYEEVRRLVAEKGLQDQVAIYSNQIAHYHELFERDEKLRQIEAQKLEKEKEYEELLKVQSQKISDSEVERMKALEHQKLVEQEEELFSKQITEMINKAEKLAREYDIETKKAIKKGDLLEKCAYPEVIAIYEEVRRLVAEKGWQDQVAVYSNQISHYHELFERDEKLRQIEAQKREKQKEYEKLQKAQTKKISDVDLERMQALEHQKLVEQEEETFRARIDRMVDTAEKLAREYDIEMKKAIKKGELLENCLYPEVIAIYEKVRSLVAERSWQDQVIIYSNQIARYLDLLEKDGRLRLIESQKREKQKEYEELQKVQTKEISDSERERLKALEQQKLVEQEEELFRGEIDQLVTNAEKLAREYEVKLKKGAKKGILDFKSKYPEVIEIYTEARKLALDKGFEKEANVFSNQLVKYSDLFAKEMKLREMEANKAKKQEEFTKMKRRRKGEPTLDLDNQKVKEVEARRKFEQEEQAFETEIDQLVDSAEKMAREYEITIKRGEFEKECPYSKIIEIYKSIREKVYIKGWTEEAKIYTNQIIHYQEKLERDNKLREIEAKKVIEQEEFKERFKKSDKNQIQKIPEIEEKDKQNQKLLDEAMNLINDTENEVKSYELSLKKDLLIYKSPYEKAISNYEKARKILKEIGWVEESNRILNTINFYKEKKARDDSLREIEKEKIEKAKIEEARAKYIPEYEPFAQEQKIMAFEKIKKKQSQDSDLIFNLINKAERLAQEYEIQKKDSILNAPSPYHEVIRLYEQAKNSFEKIGWNEEANQLDNSINYYKDKLDADKRVRELEVEKLEKEKELEDRRIVEARLAREAEAELLKQKAQALELKKRQSLEYEAKKEQAFNFMDLAKKELKQNNFDKAVRFYKNSERIFNEINWPEGIRMIIESIEIIKKRQEAIEKEKRVLKVKQEEESKLKAELEEQIAKAKDLKELQEEKRKQELLAIQEQQEYEKRISAQAYKLLEDGTELKNLKKFEQAYEKYIMGRDLFEKIGWVHEVSRINNDLLFILKKEMKQVEKIKEMQKRKIEEEKKIEFLLREAEVQRKEREKVRKEEKRKQRELVIQQRLEEANNTIKDLKYNEGILKFKKVIRKLEKIGQEKQIKQLLKQIEVIENASQIPIITIDDIESNENLDKFNTAYQALDRAQRSLSENQFMKAISEFNEAKFNLRSTIIGKKYIPIIQEKINSYKKNLGIKIEPEEELEFKTPLGDKGILREKIAARRAERKKRVNDLLGKK